MSFTDLALFEQQLTEERRDSQKKRIKIKEDLVPSNKFFLSKALCIMSMHPFFKEFKGILYDIKKASEYGLKAPLENYLAHLVYSVPAPPRGLATVNMHLMNEGPK